MMPEPQEVKFVGVAKVTLLAEGSGDAADAEGVDEAELDIAEDVGGNVEGDTDVETEPLEDDDTCGELNGTEMRLGEEVRGGGGTFSGVVEETGGGKLSEIGPTPP